MSILIHEAHQLTSAEEVSASNTNLRAQVRQIVENSVSYEIGGFVVIQVYEDVSKLNTTCEIPSTWTHKVRG